MTASLLALSPDAYHSDDTGDTPSLNATVIKALVLETPAHAKQKHPRLGGYVHRHTQAMDDGTAIHQMLLGDDRCDILDYDDFRSAAAKVARNDSRAAGRTPILRKRWNELTDLGASLKAQVAAFPIEPPLFVNGTAEQTIVWDEPNGTRGRARLDWLHRSYCVIDDLKKTVNASPRKFHRAIYSYGYDLQAAWYARAVKAAFDMDPVFRFVAIEPDPPYAMTVHVMSPAAMRSAQDRVTAATEVWLECLERNHWPAYPAIAHSVDLPSWLEPEWDDTALTQAPF